MYADSEFDSGFSQFGDDLARLTPAECGQRLSDAELPAAERAGLLCRLGWWQLQDGQLGEALAKLSEGIALFDQALLLRPDLVAAYHGRARALDGLGRFKEALANYDRAVKLATKPRAMLWRDRGCTLRSLGRYGEALTSFGKALEQQPQDALSMSAKGSLLAVLRRQKRAAMQLCDRALQLDPNLPEAWNSKGVVHSVAGQYAEAQQCYERAIALDSRLDRAWSNRGIALLRQDRVLEAIANFEQALALAPHRQEMWKASAWAHHGRALMKLGRYERAIASCDEALRLQPGYAPAALNRLLSLGMAGQLWPHLRRRETRWALLQNVGAVLNAAKLRLLLVTVAVLLLSLGQGRRRICCGRACRCCCRWGCWG
ncbi:MAG: tetratricopeptide repeat protein [Cyanobacteriota bacterium]